MKDLLFYRGQSTPNQVSLIDTSTDEHWTYSSLNNEVNKLSTILFQEGIRPMEKVGLFLDTSVNSILTIYALLRMGTLCVPISNDSSSEEISNFITTAKLNRLFWQSNSPKESLDFGIPSTSLENLPSASSINLSDISSSIPHESKLDDTCLLLFTSGTTGSSPKTVSLTYRNLLSSSISSALRLKTDSNDVWILYLPLHHMGGLSPLFRSIISGTTIATIDSPSPQNLQLCMQKYNITCLSAVPTLLTTLINEQVDLSTLRLLLLGGGPIPENLIAQCKSLSIPAYPTYGATEASSQIATATPFDLIKNPGTVGRPLNSLNLTIQNEQNQLVNEGELGEIIVSGPMVSKGYFPPDAHSSLKLSNHTFRTGDIGYMRDGFLWIMGRIDDLIITGGEKVYPVEIENILSAHPAVSDVAVFSEPDDRWGSKIVAIVVKNSPILSEEELLSFCHKKLSKYKIPKTIHFVDSIPRTVTGTFNSLAFTSNNK
ncbi:MAG: o-succinylbenzoate--CoA ligase [Halobacteriales archaeon]